jgi:hypothetical protein
VNTLERAIVTILATVLSTACGPSFALPPPCANNSTVYPSPQSGDSTLVHRASLVGLYLPPSSFRGRAVVRMLVDPHGHVVRDSTQVATASQENVALLKRSVATYQFLPATLGSCAVSSWYEITIAH